MRARSLVTLAILAGGATAAQAQQNSCPAGSHPLSEETVTQDACQKTLDLFAYMAPQLGTVIAGGNATLGQGGTLGGLGHFSIGLRINALAGSLPRVNEIEPATTGRAASTIAVSTQVLPGPAVDAALGIFKGIPLGITNVGGVDLLVSAMYLPSVETNELTVELPDGNLKLGFGARVGLLQESLLVPGVSATYLRRDLPSLNITTNTANDTLKVRELQVKTSSWRLVASKSLIVFGLAVGVGQDTYDSGGSVQAVMTGTPLGNVDSQTIVASQKITRMNYFGDVSLNLPLLKLVGEVGMVSGGEVETFNNWDGKQPADSRLYGSVGLRLSF